MKNIVQNFLTKIQKQKQVELAPLDYKPLTLSKINEISLSDAQYAENSAIVADFLNEIKKGFYFAKNTNTDVEARRSPYEYKYIPSYSKLWTKPQQKAIINAATSINYDIFTKAYGQFENENQFNKALMTEVFTHALLDLTECPLEAENEAIDSVREIAFNFVEQNITVFSDAVSQAEEKIDEIEEEFNYEIQA